MSDKFEEWFKSQISNEQYALSYASSDMKTIRKYFERNKEAMKETWDHQQQKIDKLESLLKEAMKYIDWYDLSLTHDPVHRDFENNPEIKKFRGEEV